MFWVCFHKGFEAVDAPCVDVAESIILVPADHFGGVVVVVSWVHHVCVDFDGDGVAFILDWFAHSFLLLGVLFSPAIFCVRVGFECQYYPIPVFWF